MRRVVEVAVALRYLLLAACITLSGFFAYVLVTQSMLRDDPNDWLPADSPIGNLNNYLQEKFGGGNLVTIQVSVNDGDIFNAATLAKVKRITREVGLIWGVIPYALQSIADIKTKYMRASEEFLDVTSLMDEVPKTPQAMERLKWGVYNNPLIYGSLVSPDVKSTVIQADFRTGLGLSKRKDLPVTDPVSIYKAINEIIAKEKDSNHVVQAAGTPIIIGWVNSDGLFYIALAFLVFVSGVTAVLWRAFRSFRGAFIAVALGLVASLWAFGWKAVLHGPVLESASALIAPFIIVAAAACHHTQFLKRFFDEEYPKVGEARLAIVNTCTPLLFPLVGSLVTDVVAFAVMAVVPFKNVSELGLTATYGLLSIVCNVFLLQIPMLALLHGTPREIAAIRARRAERRKVWIVRALENLVNDLVNRSRRGKMMVAVVLGAFLASLACFPFLDPGQDNTYAIHNFLTHSWKNNEIFQMEQHIKEHFAAVYPLTILIDSGKEDGLKDPQVEQAIEDYSRFMLKQPGVKGALGLPDYIKVLNQLYEGGDPKHYRVPDDPQAVGLELEYYQEGFPGSFDAVTDTAL
jgi:predicted RND superfamily exporter protein